MSEQIQYCEGDTNAIPREMPYLGPLDPGITPNEKGHFIRPGNGSIYSTSDQSVLVKVRTSGGATGWGECVTVVGPHVVVTILEEIVFPLIRGRDPHEAAAIYADLYDAMRVRGFFGGHYHDALAALDIALWDLRGKLADLPVSRLLGSHRRDRIPAYVSGLPGETRNDRVAIAKGWVERGFQALKFAGAVAHDGEFLEMQSLREALGPTPKILIDFHWRYTAAEAIQKISQLERFDLYIAEAPVAPEDISGQARVAAALKIPVGIGEELRTIYEYLPRFEARCMDVIQPEMGRTGVTSFVDICKLSQAFHCRVMPHASIGIGIFQAASLQVAATLSNCPYHEYQHSIFDKNLRYITGDMSCASGYFHVPTGPGLGVEPNEEALSYRIGIRREAMSA